MRNVERLQPTRLPAVLNGPMARQSSYSLAIKLFAAVSGFLFSVAAARLLGPTGYGVVAVAVSVATIAATVAPLGSNGLAVREVARSFARAHWSNIRRFFRWSGTLVIGVAMLIGVALVVIAPWTGPYRTALPYAAALVPILAGSLWLRAVIQGSSRPIAAQMPGDAIRWSVTLVSIGAFAAFGSAFSPDMILLAYIAGCLVAFAVSMTIARRILCSIPETDEHAAEPVVWLRASLPFLGVTAIGILGTEINTLLLGSMSGPREAGLYQPIARIAPMMLLVRDAVEMPLAPRIVHDWERGETAQLQSRLHRAAAGSTIVTAIVATAVILAAPLILAAFGKEFVVYGYLLLWVGIAQLVNSAMGAAPLLLSMVGGMKERIIAQLMTLVVQAGLAFALVPIWGARGAAISLVAAILVWSLANWILAWRSTGLNTSIFSTFWSNREQ
jgi:O-antigen/teichoic acid export membrane protein